MRPGHQDTISGMSLLTGIYTLAIPKRWKFSERYRTRSRIESGYIEGFPMLVR